MTEIFQSIYYQEYQCQDPSNCQPFPIILRPGLYQIELWGARSGVCCLKSGPAYGAYVSGQISIKRKTKFYVYLGGVGGDGVPIEKSTRGWNGGGYGKYGGSGGGGASDIRLTDKLQSRIMVAAGAGGGERASTGHGGRLTGLTGQSSKCGDSQYFLDHSSSPGNQTHGGQGGYKERYGTAGSGQFGQGGDGSSSICLFRKWRIILYFWL